MAAAVGNMDVIAITLRAFARHLPGLFNSRWPGYVRTFVPLQDSAKYTTATREVGNGISTYEYVCTHRTERVATDNTNSRLTSRKFANNTRLTQRTQSLLPKTNSSSSANSNPVIQLHSSRQHARTRNNNNTPGQVVNIYKENIGLCMLITST